MGYIVFLLGVALMFIVMAGFWCAIAWLIAKLLSVVLVAVGLSPVSTLVVLCLLVAIQLIKYWIND